MPPHAALVFLRTEFHLGSVLTEILTTMLFLEARPGQRLAVGAAVLIPVARIRLSNGNRQSSFEENYA